jgi:hypothetical protein
MITAHETQWEDILIKGIKKWFLPLLLMGAIFVVSPASRAQEITARGVGVVGGIVAGAESVLVVESIVRVKPLWPWLVIPAAGAIGGGIGGYKLEKASRGGAIALLITSMVGVIPTMIAVSSARSFHPEDVGARQGAAETPPAVEVDISNESDTGTTTVRESSGEATVEVEARPDGIPDGMGPPAPESDSTTEPVAPVAPEDEAAAPAESTGGKVDVEMESGDAESGEGAAPADTPADDDLNTEKEPSAQNIRKAEQLAHLAGGALLHVNRAYRLGLGIPAIDVYPVQFPQPHTHLSGTEVYIPVLSMDLP